MHPQVPEPNEYAPYYSKYISLVKSDDLLATLTSQARDTCALLGTVSEDKANSRYEPGKWSVKEVLGHITDTERVFSYRALRIGRNDQCPIEGYEQDDYVRYGHFDRCPLSELLEEFQTVRHATLLLLKKFDTEAWLRRGTANQNEVSVRALGYIIAGHELHHRAILKDKYLSA
jgi:hypothetical protein